MSEQRNWDLFRAWHFHDSELDLDIDLSRMGLPADWFDAYAEPMAKAIKEMEALENGAIANPDEQRRVGHYWLRAPELAPENELTRQIRAMQEAVRDFALDVHSGAVRPEARPRFTGILSLGIGGSALGPELLADALAPEEPPLWIRFLDNTDPDGFDRALRAIGDELASTLVLVISKSGTTPEPRNASIEIERAFRQRGLAFARHAVAITGEGSELDRTASAKNWLRRFPMWDWVGGRTSVLSAVGLLPAALSGIAIEQLLEGAASMDRMTRRTSVSENPAALLAIAWHAATGGRGEKDMVVLPYKDRLILLARYLQQLIMESLGKERDLAGNIVHQGISVYGNKGSTDQHAFVQQLRDGVPNFFVTFVDVLRDRDGPSVEVEPGVSAGDYLHGFLLGTREALSEAKRPSLTITLPDVSPRSLGALIALYERAVGYYASLVGINAYHQPGVEAGKKAASRVLEIQGRMVELLRETNKAALSVEEIDERLGLGDPETIFHILRHLAATRSELTFTGANLLERRYSWKP